MGIFSGVIFTDSDPSMIQLIKENRVAIRVKKNHLSEYQASVMYFSY
jgi:hypothetical protein